jgi:hypothetical protein
MRASSWSAENGAVEVGQAEVEDDDVGVPLQHLGQALHRPAGGPDGVAPLGQRPHQSGPDPLIVLDERHGGHGSSSPNPPRRGAMERPITFENHRESPELCGLDVDLTSSSHPHGERNRTICRCDGFSF